MKRLVGILITLIVLLATVGSVGAITWGQPDGTRHPNVVAILFRRGNFLYTCTGTLLSPTVVLTAGHCTEENGIVNMSTWVRNDPDIDAAFASERPNYPGTLAWINATWVSGQAVPHPQYDDYALFPDTYDIGVILLSKPIIVPQYGQLPELGQFDYLTTAKGALQDRRVTVVGYGLQGKIPAFAGDNWVRYFAYSAILTTGSNMTGTQNFLYANNPGQGTGGGGTCSGDSGGPAFWIDPKTNQETNIVVGVNSYGITPKCNGNDYQFRTDIAAAQDFVLPYLR